MVDQSRFKKKSLGAPPSMPEDLSMLAEPEVAPSAPEVAVQLPEPSAVSMPEVPLVAPVRRVDGRRFRRTGRTVQISTRVTEASRDMIYSLAEKHGLMVAEVIERGAELLRLKLSRK